MEEIRPWPARDRFPRSPPSMTARKGQLTAAFVRSVNRPGVYGDQHGLRLRVYESRKLKSISKHWPHGLRSSSRDWPAGLLRRPARSLRTRPGAREFRSIGSRPSPDSSLRAAPDADGGMLGLRRTIPRARRALPSPAILSTDQLCSGKWDCNILPLQRVCRTPQLKSAVYR